MSSGVMKAALSSFITESTIPESSIRGATAKEAVERFLGEEIVQDEFDRFTDRLFGTIEGNISTTISSNSSLTRHLLKEKVWTSFHKLRLKDLPDLWESYFKKISKERFDPVVEQHTNSVIFEGILKTHIPPMSYSATEIELSTDEENIIRYAAGYVPLNIMKKYEKQSSEIAAECI